MGKVEQIARAYAAKTTGKLGVGFLDLVTGEEFYINGDAVFPAASTFKVPLLVGLFDEVAKGNASLDEMHTLTEDEFATGGGVLSLLTPGVTLPLRDYALLMMIISDNTATDVIYRYLGRERIDAIIRKMGLTHTRCDISCDHLVRLTYSIPTDIGAREAIDMFNSGSPFDDRLYAHIDGPNDVSSPEDMVSIFSQIYHGQITSRECCAQMMNIMKQCQTNSRIPYYLPGRGPLRAEVAHKTGSLSMVANDSGVVMANGHDYILSLFCFGYEADEAEKAQYATAHFFDHLMAELSRDVFYAVHEG